MNFKLKSVSDGKYIEVKYTEYVPSNVTIDVNMRSNSTYVMNEESANKLMANIELLKIRVAEIVKEHGLIYDTPRIIAEHVVSIERWGDDMFAISKLDNEEMAQWLVKIFDKEYTETKTKCENTLKNLKENNVSYLSNFREHDDYTRNNAYWEFGLEPIENLYGKDPLDKMLGLTQEMIDLIDKIK